MATKENPEVVAPARADRVVGLSVRRDGTLDQVNPEIIGDKDDAVAATKRQFAEMAVSAVDSEKRQELGLASPPDTEPGPDKAIDALKAEHDRVAAEAEQQAESVVNALYREPETRSRRDELAEQAVAASAPENASRRSARP